MYIMKLKDKYFDFIKDGSKEYEIRLNDEKRRLLKKGDFIEFQKEPLLNDKFICEVDDLLYFNSFESLIEAFDIELLASSEESKDELLCSLNCFYTIEEQKKYGVVAIKLKKDYSFVVKKDFLYNINVNDDIFLQLRNNYNDFDEWFLKLSNNNEVCYFTKNENVLSSILILKIGEDDSQQIDEKNVLKIRTLNVLESNKGIGSFYLRLVEKIARLNGISTIYLTCIFSNKNFISFIQKKGFYLYKSLLDEGVYVKKVD